jgi:predicted membrane protein
VRELLFELLLRLPKVILATAVALIAWWLATSFAGAASSAELWMLCFIGGGVFVLLVQEGPI